VPDGYQETASSRAAVFTKQLHQQFFIPVSAFTTSDWIVSLSVDSWFSSIYTADCPSANVWDLNTWTCVQWLAIHVGLCRSQSRLQQSVFAGVVHPQWIILGFFQLLISSKTIDVIMCLFLVSIIV